ILEPGRKVVHKVRGTNKLRKVYVHLTSTGGELKINDEVLKQGDGAFVTNVKCDYEISFESTGTKNAEFVLFDLA
ncbi:2789_t:CDS:1, partial [Acaulospora morrowiae]